MSNSKPSGGHSSLESLTSRIKLAEPIQNANATRTDHKTWPEYLRMQYPSATITYDSGSLGNIEIRLPPTPKSDEDSNLLGNYLWDSGLLLSQLVANSAQYQENPRWSVQGLQVLELGSGTGLVGITCALAGAERAVLTDYPSSEILENIRRNVETNAISRRQAPSKKQKSVATVEAHKWGEVDDDFATSNAHNFTRVIATACLWLAEQHENIAKSMTHFLAKSENAEVWIVSGFFLGRKKLAGFFDIARKFGLSVREVFEQNAVGVRREWMVDRQSEDEKDIVEQGWLLVAVLCQKGSEVS